MLRLPLLLPSGPYISKDTTLIRSMAGEPLAEVCLAPPLLAVKVLRELGGMPQQTFSERLQALRRAGELFATATLAGETPEDYVRRQSLASGIPAEVAARSLDQMRHFLADMESVIETQRPTGAVMPTETLPRGAVPLWVPRGRTLAVIAPSNHPMTHVSWLQALAFGYGVAVRAGSQDPFTPLRLAHALHLAGLGSALAVLSGPHTMTDSLVSNANLSILYGGTETIARYRANPKVLVRGPGRSRVLVDASGCGASTLDVLVEAVAADGGARCTNASALLLGQGCEDLAGALADRLGELPAARAGAPDGALPVFSVQDAWALKTTLDRLVAGAEVLVAGGGEPIIDLGDGTAALRPMVVQCRADHPHFATELPFPLVWAAPWQPADGLAPLQDCLSLTMLTQDGALVQQALFDPSIRKVNWGPVPTWYSQSTLPHDGYLGQFLMEAKAFVAKERDDYGGTAR